MKYTKSPWQIGHDGWVTGGDGSLVISYLGCGSHEAYFDKEEDKKLVESAPELYECFKELLFKIDNQGKSEFLESALRKRCLTLLDKLKEIE